MRWKNWAVVSSYICNAEVFHKREHYVCSLLRDGHTVHVGVFYRLFVFLSSPRCASASLHIATWTHCEYGLEYGGVVKTTIKRERAKFRRANFYGSASESGREIGGATLQQRCSNINACNIFPFNITFSLSFKLGYDPTWCTQLWSLCVGLNLVATDDVSLQPTCNWISLSSLSSRLLLLPLRLPPSQPVCNFAVHSFALLALICVWNRFR